MTATKTIAMAAIATTLLAGCGGGDAGQISQTNPNYFAGRTDARSGVIAGFYNPAGFSSDDVQALLATTCRGRALETYGELPQDGLMAYSGRCAGGFSFNDGFVEFERATPGTVVVETLGSDGSGNLMSSQAAQSL